LRDLLLSLYLIKMSTVRVVHGCEETAPCGRASEEAWLVAVVIGVARCG
jgi:hypothetical protein